MASNLIFEDDIECDIINVFESEALGFEYLNCYTVEANDLNDKSNRADKKQGVLLDRLHIALKHLNSKLPDDAINVAIEKLTQSHIQQAAFDANKTVYKLVRGGLEVDVTNSNGRTEKRTVQVLDFANPKNNDFLLVAQI